MKKIASHQEKHPLPDTTAGSALAAGGAGVASRSNMDGAAKTQEDQAAAVGVGVAGRFKGVCEPRNSGGSLLGESDRRRGRSNGSREPRDDGIARGAAAQADSPDSNGNCEPRDDRVARGVALADSPDLNGSREPRKGGEGLARRGRGRWGVGAFARVRGVEAAELALAALGRVSAEEMGAGELEELSATLGRIRTRTSDLLRAVAAAARDSKSVDAVRLLGGRAGLANREVRRMKRVAERLEEMPNTSERLRSASITFEHAAALADAAAECGAKTVDNDPRLLELAEKVPIDQYFKETRSFAGKHAPDRGKARLNWQRKRRQASLYTEESTGMGVLRALFDPISFNLLRQTVDRHTDALWRKDGGREGRPETLRTPQQRTSDAIYELLTGKPAPAHKPKKQEKPQQTSKQEEPTPTRPPKKRHAGRQTGSSDQTRRQHGQPQPKEQNAGAKATKDGTTTDPAPPPNGRKKQERTHQSSEHEGRKRAEEPTPTRPTKEQNAGRQPGRPAQVHRPAEQSPTQQTEEASADRAGKPASIQSPDASNTASKDVRNNKATGDSITGDTYLTGNENSHLDIDTYEIGAAVEDRTRPSAPDSRHTQNNCTPSPAPSGGASPNASDSGHSRGDGVSGDTGWFKAKNASQLIVVADIGVLDGTNPHGRCEILGTGPVPPDILQELTPDTELASIIFAGNGQPLWLGRSRRLANDHQRLAVAARDRGCVLCNAPMHLCEIHHIKEWNTREGPTDIENLAAICGHHHRWLHNNNQQLIHSPDNGGWTTKPRPPKQPPPHQRTPSKHSPTEQATNQMSPARDRHGEPPPEQAMSERATSTSSQARRTEQKPTQTHNPQAREKQRPPPIRHR